MGLQVKIAVAIFATELFAAPTLAKSPGTSVNGSLTIGPFNAFNSAIQIFDWQVNDAGPSTTFPNAPGVVGAVYPSNYNVASGWSLIASEIMYFPGLHSSGNLTWTATSEPGSQFDLQLETLVGPTTPVGTTTDGPMSDFDPARNYAWPVVAWQGTYTGPTDSATLTADTVIDTSMFANSLGANPGTFSIVYNGNPIVLNQGTMFEGSLDLVYTPVPEPGTLVLVGLAAAGVAWRVNR